MNRYWEAEKPPEAATAKNKLRWYREAGKCAISTPDWEDSNGEMKQGKTVTLDLAALKNSPEALRLIEQAVTETEG